MKTYSFRVSCELNHARVTAPSKKAAVALYAAAINMDAAHAASLYAGIANEDAQGVVNVLMPVTHGIFERYLKSRVVDRLREFRDYVTAYPNAFAVLDANAQLVTVR